jgi:hypothetical protein
MVLSHRALPYRCYRATNATNVCIGHVPTVPTPPYRFVGQFANTAYRVLFIFEASSFCLPSVCFLRVTTPPRDCISSVYYDTVRQCQIIDSTPLASLSILANTQLFVLVQSRPEATQIPGSAGRSRQCNRQQGRSTGSPQAVVAGLWQGVNSRRAAISQGVGRRTPEDHVILLDRYPICRNTLIEQAKKNIRTTLWSPCIHENSCPKPAAEMLHSPLLSIRTTCKYSRTAGVFRELLIND